MKLFSAIARAACRRSGNGRCHRIPVVVRLRSMAEKKAHRAPASSSLGKGARRTLGPACSLFLVLICLTSAAYAVPAGTLIENTARANYRANGVETEHHSNTLSLVTTWPRTTAQIEMLQYAPGLGSADTASVPVTNFDLDGTSGGATQTIAAVYPAGSTTVIDLSQPVSLVAADVFHQGEPFFFQVVDNDQNVDSLVAETVWVLATAEGTGDTELLLLTETGPDSGMFMGYIQSSGLGPVGTFNGTLDVAENNTVSVLYTDATDSSDTVSLTAMVDPFGLVFDSTSGEAVDNVQLTLVTGAGAPATVYGDDGISIFPSTITSGGTYVDTSGKIYDFPVGNYRFPFVAPGTYRLIISPPSGYTAPSTVSTDTLQTLSGAPFVIAEPGSRGEAFVLNPGPAVRMDIPVDPASTGLWVRKSANRTLAAIGDFVQYTLTVQNNAGQTAQDVTVSDRLPKGFRYRSGSARLDGLDLSDPEISDDGRTLSFSVGDIEDTESVEIRYVTQVTTARPGEARNLASARAANGYDSNTAAVAVTIKEDLFRSDNFIAGRVTADNCPGHSPGHPPGHPPETNDGVAGVRLYLEDGTYVITDDQGRYHFEGISSGTHVVQLDPSTIPETYEIARCKDDSRWAGSLFSRFVDLQGGTLWRVDFHLQSKTPPTGSVRLHMTCGLQDGSVTYQALIDARQVGLDNLRLSVMLPEGTVYAPGSSLLDDQPLEDPRQMDNVLIYRLGDMPEPEARTVRFGVRLLDTAESGRLHTKALLAYDTAAGANQRTEPVDTILALNRHEERLVQPAMVVRPQFDVFSIELTPEDRDELDRMAAALRGLEIEHAIFTGHTDNRPIRPGPRNPYADNQALSRARAQAVADYLAGRLNLTPDRMTVVGKGAAEPVASNSHAAGRALNRRVEITIMSVKVNWIHDIASIKCEGVVKAETRGTFQSAAPADPPAVEPPATGDDAGDMDVESLSPGTAFLMPAPGFYPQIPSIKLAVQHDPAEKIELLRDNRPVSPLNFEGRRVNKAGTVAVSFWRGVDLAEGDNAFTVVRKDRHDRELGRLERTVHYSGPPVNVELISGASHLVANGKDTPVIALRLTDKHGHPARAGVFGDYSVQPPHQPYQAQEEGSEARQELSRRSLNGAPHESLRYTVGRDGMVRIRLQPTSQSGQAVIKIPLGGTVRKIHAWLQPEVREWILVGLAEGTAGYNIVSGNMENLADAGQEEDYYQEGRLAFFAKGRIKGQWLLTAAYDSRRDRNDPENRLFQAIDPGTFYTLYGDTGQQQYDAASIDKLYLKIERDRFYALFGDFDTGLDVTELSRYSRRANGLKAEYNGEKYGLNLFATDTRQAFVKDEIRGDGTSGLYRLSRGGIVVNSETVTIETRDRIHSEVIVSSETLTRFVDYSIDYDEGTLFFKSPVYSRDEEFNPIYIVVDYESEDLQDRDYTYGGRGSLKLMDQRMEVGATVIHEGGRGAQGDLGGLDARIDVGHGVEIKAEAATSQKESGTDENDGNAYLAEITKKTSNLNAKAYIREQAEGFGLGQQNGSETATRKLGAEAAWRFKPDHTVSSELYHQHNLATDARRDVGEARWQYSQSVYSLSAGLRQVEDRYADGTTDRATQALVGADRRFMDNRMQLRINHEQLLNNGGSVDFPTRSVLGADYQLTDHAALFGEHEMTWNDDVHTQSSRAGLKAAPWTGGTVGTSLGREYADDGERLFAAMGLYQTWRINDQWHVDGGLDRSQTVAHGESSSFNTNVQAASGSDHDFTAVSLGAGYAARSWSWTGRVEARYADTQDKWGLTTGIAGQVRQGLGLSAGLQWFDTQDHADADDGTDTFESDLRLSLAWRPNNGPWIVFDRLDYTIESESDASGQTDARRIVNNFNASYKPRYDLQVALQYGAKYVFDTIDGRNYDGYTDLTGIETRYNLTERWDVGLQASLLHAWNVGQLDYRTGVSVGYSLFKNTWVSLGYNFTGFNDEDFSAADFTAAGPYIKFRLKFDQQSVREMVDWFGENSGF